MTDTNRIWRRVEEALRWHIKPGKDVDANAVLNRLAGEYFENLPCRLNTASCSISEQQMSSLELTKVERRHDRTAPRSLDGPVVLFTYAERIVAIDGNNRINVHLKTKNLGFIFVIVVKLDNRLIQLKTNQ